jgi:hypothetical protein
MTPSFAFAITEDEPQGLALERNLILKLWITEPALGPMHSYEAENITSPSSFYRGRSKSPSNCHQLCGAHHGYSNYLTD